MKQDNLQECVLWGKMIRLPEGSRIIFERK